MITQLNSLISIFNDIQHIQFLYSGLTDGAQLLKSERPIHIERRSNRIKQFLRSQVRLVKELAVSDEHLRL